MKLIDKQLLDDISRQAQKSDRLRMKLMRDMLTV